MLRFLVYSTLFILSPILAFEFIVFFSTLGINYTYQTLVEFYHHPVIVTTNLIILLRYLSELLWEYLKSNMSRPMSDFPVILYILAVFTPPLSVYFAHTRNRKWDTFINVLLLFMFWFPAVIHAIICIRRRSGITDTGTTYDTEDAFPVMHLIDPYPPARQVTFHDQPQFSSAYHDEFPALVPGPYGTPSRDRRRQSILLNRAQREAVVKIGPSSPLRQSTIPAYGPEETTIPGQIVDLPELEHTPSRTPSFIAGRPDILQTPQHSPAAPARIYNPQDSPSSSLQEYQSPENPLPIPQKSPPAYTPSDTSTGSVSSSPGDSFHAYPPKKASKDTDKGKAPFTGGLDFSSGESSSPEPSEVSYPPRSKGKDVPRKLPPIPQVTTEPEDLLKSPVRLSGPRASPKKAQGKFEQDYFGPVTDIPAKGEGAYSSSRRESDTTLTQRQIQTLPVLTTFSQEQYLKDWEEYEAKRLERLTDEERKQERKAKMGLIEGGEDSEHPEAQAEGSGTKQV